MLNSSHVGGSNTAIITQHNVQRAAVQRLQVLVSRRHIYVVLLTAPNKYRQQLTLPTQVDNTRHHVATPFRQCASSDALPRTTPHGRPTQEPGGLTAGPHPAAWLLTQPSMHPSMHAHRHPCRVDAYFLVNSHAFTKTPRRHHSARQPQQQEPPSPAQLNCKPACRSPTSLRLNAAGARQHHRYRLPTASLLPPCPPAVSGC